MDNDNKPAKFCYPYPHAAITADCIVFGYDPNKTLRVLLVKRRNEPYKDCWAFPGGFMEIDEDLETCARREVMEETGLTIRNVKYFSSQPWPYPSGLMVGYTAEYVDGEIHLQKEELSRGKWFSKDNLPILPEKLSIARRLIDAWLEGKI